MADRRIKVQITAAIDAFCGALRRVFYRLHEPLDVDDGAICRQCVEPWPCEELRDFEKRRSGVDTP